MEATIGRTFSLGRVLPTTPTRNHSSPPLSVAGVTVAPFESVNIYPLIAKILGLDIQALKTRPIDGKLSALQSILKKPN